MRVRFGSEAALGRGGKLRSDIDPTSRLLRQLLPQMNVRRLLPVLTVLAAMYVALSVLMVVANILWVTPRNLVGAGCVRVDALGIAVACNGFPFADIAEKLLTLPWAQLQSLFVFIGIFIAPLWSLLLLPIALLLWAPVVYLAWRIGLRRRTAA